MDETPEKQDPADGEGTPARLPPFEGLLGLFFEEVPCFVSILDSDLNIIKVNNLCREHFAVPFTRRCFQTFKGRDAICLDCPATATFADGRVSDSEEVLTDRSGREKHVICRTAPIHDDQGRVAAVLHMCAQAGPEEKLQRDIKATDSQIGAVSHGIKGLLTAMEGGFYLWESGVRKNKPDRLEKGFEIVRRSFGRLQRLAHCVLYYVRDRRLIMERLDGAALLRKVAADMEEDARFAGARIRADGSAAHELILEADLRALESVLVNLIVSSLDDCRTDKRAIDHEVVLSARREDGFAVFEVADNGVGMEPETLEKIFSLFFSPKGIEAAGVGLYITSKLVRAHRGRVNIQSEPGKGTRYQVRMPLQPPARPASPESSGS